MILINTFNIISITFYIKILFVTFLMCCCMTDLISTFDTFYIVSNNY